MKFAEQDGRDWSSKTFGCFDDFKLCIITFFVPCYTLGKNAEKLGEDSTTICLLACLGFPFGPTLRWRIRQEKGIRGSMVMDNVCWVCCGYCTLCQEARELAWGDNVTEIKEEVQEIAQIDRE